jgi:hypothetical protein
MPAKKNLIDLGKLGGARAQKGRWGRAQTARALGVSISRVRQLEREGKLLAHVDEQGVHTFEPRAIGALAKRRTSRRQVDGEIAARVFRMIADGFPLRDIVIETAQSPETVRKLHAEYSRPFGGAPRDELLEHFDKSGAELDERIARQQGRMGGGTTR